MHVSFFGNFGTGNLGNECTLQAIVHNVRKYLPDATVECVCPDPDDVATRHRIRATWMSDRFRKETSARGEPGRPNPMIRALRRILVGIPREIAQWIKAYRALEGSDALVVAGTGILGDFGIQPLDLHYEVLKWCAMARLRGCKVLFVSVGASGLRRPLSRWFVKLALSGASYRSYRDGSSKAFLGGIGVDTARDFVYPDLAFSLPRPESAPRPRGATAGRVIGLGLMAYHGRDCSPDDGRQTYREYVDRVAAFAAWLLDRGDTVRLLVGDLTYDTRVRQDVTAAVQRRTALPRDRRLISEPVASVDDLVVQIAGTDMVVATRYHNLVLALMLRKPVVSIAYDRKHDALMAGVGLGAYSQDIETLDVDRLIAQVLDLEAEAARLAPAIEEKAEAPRRALDEQYGRIFHEVLR